MVSIDLMQLRAATATAATCN